VSWEISGQVKELRVAADGSKVTALEKLVLLMLSEFYNRTDGYARPGIDHLAEDCSLSRRATQQTLYSCEAKGLLRIERQPSMPGRHQEPSHYYFTLPGLPSIVRASDARTPAKVHAPRARTVRASDAGVRAPDARESAHLTTGVRAPRAPEPGTEPGYVQPVSKPRSGGRAAARDIRANGNAPDALNGARRPPPARSPNVVASIVGAGAAQLAADLTGPPAASGESAAEIWQRTLADLQLQMRPEDFRTWFRDTELLRLHDGRATVGVENPFNVDWLSTKCRALVERTLHSVTGTVVAVEFVTADAATSRSAPPRVAPDSPPAAATGAS
jgi:hypothetical protein